MRIGRRVSAHFFFVGEADADHGVALVFSSAVVTQKSLPSLLP